jgi:integrase
VISICRWPDKDESLIEQYATPRPKLGNWKASHCGWLRQFQRFVCKQSRGGVLSESVFRRWIKTSADKFGSNSVIRHTYFVKGFLDWLVMHGHLKCHPLAELQKKYECRSVRAITQALMNDDPDAALEALRPMPLWGSHLGPVMRAHIERMRTLGYRYRNDRHFLRFDRFLQRRPGAAKETLLTLIREYVAQARTADAKHHRFTIGRIVAKALYRQGVSTVIPKMDRLLSRRARASYRRPYIYTPAEIRLLLDTALQFPSPCAPLRPISLYTMFVLAYCAGLRLGEIVRLKLEDVDLENAAIDIRDSKFFKSRRLPLSSTAMLAVNDYLKARHRAHIPPDPDSPLFCYDKGSYSYLTAGYMLRLVIRRAGLKKEPGRRGPRLHDVRHAFAVHRLTRWYEQGVQPESRLPFLAAYLGHRDINSTLTYLTITEDLLQHANQRFRTAQADVLKVIRRRR